MTNEGGKWSLPVRIPRPKGNITTRDSIFLVGDSAFICCGKHAPARHLGFNQTGRTERNFLRLTSNCDTFTPNDNNTRQLASEEVRNIYLEFHKEREPDPGRTGASSGLWAVVNDYAGDGGEDG